MTLLSRKIKEEMQNELVELMAARCCRTKGIKKQ